MEFISSLEIFNVITQIGLALSGACSLWGAVFSFQMRGKGGIENQAYAGILKAIFGLFVAGFILVHVGVIGKYVLIPSVLSAHEGIVVTPSVYDAARGLWMTLPLLGVFSLLGLTNLFLFFRKGAAHLARSYMFFGLQFAVAFVVMSTMYFDESAGRVQMFFAGHSFHSIFTLGTVIVLDMLFFLSSHIPSLRPVLYPKFDTISKVIWVGLGIDFLSVWLIFDQGFALHDKFYFMQTAVAILIMNGALLSVPMSQAFNRMLKGISMSRRLSIIAGISGAVSVSSWLSITLVDGFSKLPFSYGEFLIGYGILIILAALTHFTFLDREPGRKLAYRITGV